MLRASLDSQKNTIKDNPLEDLVNQDYGGFRFDPVNGGNGGRK